MHSVFKVSPAGLVGGFLALAAVMCLILPAACGRSARPGVDSASPASVSLILISGVQRGIGESKSAEAVWISDEKQWNRLISSIPVETLGIPPQSAGAADIDFTKYGVLLIRMGEKPNGGYRLTLTADTASVENREARIPVRWSEPEPEYMYTQAIVYPYIVVKMEKGAFDNIAVVDQKGLVGLRVSAQK
jgi:hypothetical protein